MSAQSILVVRRDNIGDLICTTPLIRALKEQLPDASISALVTRYNEPVLLSNPDIAHIYSYQKAKHLKPGDSLLNIYWQRLRMMVDMRREHFDWILLPGGAHQSSMRFARFASARNILVRGAQDNIAGNHEVEQTCHLLTRMGLRYATPHERIVADPLVVKKIRQEHDLAARQKSHRLIAIHVSARKISQRWPAEKFAELIKQLSGMQQASFMLLWAPGSPDDPLHPGDDEKAATIMSLLQAYPVVPVPTHKLEELIAALSLCDQVVCADGGAMHIASALGKPIVCLFGHSSAEQWHPWGVPYILLQKDSHEVTDISVEEVVRAFQELESKL